MTDTVSTLVLVDDDFDSDGWYTGGKLDDVWSGDVEIRADRRLARFRGSLAAPGGIRAGEGIEAGEGIKAGSGIEAGSDYGIYAGLSIRISLKAQYALVVAKTKPENILLGEYRELM